MNNLSFLEIKHMADINDKTELALHWEGSNAVTEKTDAISIMWDIEEEKYSIDQFDQFAYCCNWKDYINEQNEAK